MKNKNGAATLYVVVGIIIFLAIMTYVFNITSNMEIDMLTYFNKIKQTYREKTTESKKEEILNKIQQDANNIQMPSL